MRHALLWEAQVRAVSSSQAREERAGLLPRAKAWSKVLSVPLPTSPHFSAYPSFPPSPRSFCCEHRPQQIVEADPEPDTACIICLEPVGDKKSYHTMVCPVCIQAWFHQSCIQVGALPLLCSHRRCSAAPGPAHTLAACVLLPQGQAMSAGILRFQCPVCRDRMQFRTQMHILGIQIPARLVPSFRPAL